MSTWTLKEKSIGDLEVVIEGEEWKKATDKAFNKIAKNVVINGFRKGSAPKALIEKRVSVGERMAQAVEDNANEWMRAALEEKELSPISQPQLDVKEMDESHVVLTFTFAVMPEVKLGEYKGLKYEMADTSVSEEEFNAELDRMRQTYADLESKEGAAEEGDTVNIDYEGFKDGVAFDGGKAEGYNLELGSKSFIPGFEDQLVGVKAGEEKELNLTFPEEYQAAELAGAAVVFKVKVNDVKTKVLPELDDDFAKDISAPGVETVEDLKKMIRDRLESGKKNAAEQTADNALMDQLAANIEADIPDALVDEEVQNQVNQLAAQIQQYGMGLAQYLQMMGKTAEDLKADYAEQALKTVKLRLALEKIAEAESLEPTEEEVEKEYANIAEQYSMEVERVKSLIAAEMLKKDVKNQKAYEFVKENAEKTTAAPAKPAKKTAAKKTTAKKTTKKAEGEAEEKPAKKTAAKKTTAKKTTKKAEEATEAE